MRKTVDNNLFYLCGCTDNSAGGIYLFDFDGGQAEQKSFLRLSGVNYLCFSEDRKFVYASLNIQKRGYVAACRVNPDFSLTYSGMFETGGTSACHLTCSPDGKYLFVTNYSSGDFSIFKLNAEGSIRALLQTIPTENKHSEADVVAHPHCALISPDKKYLCIVDLGLDMIATYRLDRESGIVHCPVSRCDFPKGNGPRHLIFSKSGKAAFVVSELGNTVSSLRYNNGDFSLVMSASTLPEDFTGTSYAAAIRFSDDEKYLYATNRGHDSIACFRILDDARIKLCGIENSGGSNPRDAAFVTSGGCFAAANEFSDRVCFFETGQGKLKYIDGAEITACPHPICIQKCAE